MSKDIPAQPPQTPTPATIACDERTRHGHWHTSALGELHEQVRGFTAMVLGTSAGE